MNKVSVIIPNYNRETLIGETIANLLAQTLPPYEIIVVDDGSTDQSVAVIGSFGDKIKLIEQANQGPGTARNVGLRAATGDFIQFQDSDDLFSLNKLESQIAVLEQNGADIAFSPWVKVTLKDGRATLEDHVLQQAMPSARMDLPCWWLRGWSTVFQSLLFRRSFLNKVGGYRADLHLGEDGELFFRMLTSSPRVAFTNEALMLYRLHNINKITQDEGAPQMRRMTDWTRCLCCMIEQSESCGLKTDFLTRSIFLAGVRKHLRYFQPVPDAASALVKELTRYTGQLPGWWLAGVEGWLRLNEHIRLRRSGSRWMAGYQAGPPTEKQRQLILELGFKN